MSDDCIGCNPDHQSGHLCNSCKSALKTGRFFNTIRNKDSFFKIQGTGDKLVILFSDDSGTAGDTLEDAVTTYGLNVE